MKMKTGKRGRDGSRGPRGRAGSAVTATSAFVADPAAWAAPLPATPESAINRLALAMYARAPTYGKIAAETPQKLYTVPKYNGGSTDAVFGRVNSSGALQWVSSASVIRPYTTSLLDGSEVVVNSTADNAGNLFVAMTYSYHNLTAYNADQTQAASIAAGGVSDNSVYTAILKYNGSGVLQWYITIDPGIANKSTNLSVFYMGCDSDNNLYVAGQYLTSKVRVTSSNGTQSVTSTTAPSSAAFLTKLDASGVCQWISRMEFSSNVSVTWALASAYTHSNGHTCLPMRVHNTSLTTDVTLTLYGGNGAVFSTISIPKIPSSSARTTTSFAFFINATGAFTITPKLVSSVTPDAGTCAFDACTMDASNNIYLAFKCGTNSLVSSTSVYNADGTLYTTIANEVGNIGWSDSALVKFSNTGTGQWCILSRGIDYDGIQRLFITPTGQLYAGIRLNLQPTYVFNADGTLAFSTTSFNGSTTTMLCRISTAGTILWAARLSGVNLNQAPQQTDNLRFLTGDNDKVVFAINDISNPGLFNADGSIGVWEFPRSGAGLIVATYSSNGYFISKLGVNVLGATALGTAYANSTNDGGFTFVANASTPLLLLPA